MFKETTLFLSKIFSINPHLTKLFIYTIITAIIIYLLRKLIMLNIPVIGDYIADIVEIVENNR